MPGAVDDVAQYYTKFFPHGVACALLGRAWRGSSQLHLRELCVETKDSGSPYDTCQFETCSCDASCRDCCNAQ